jgi:hypothetical protein
MCASHKENIVIHYEDSALQHFHPLSLLLRFTRTMATKSEMAVLGSVPPFMTITKIFIFPNALGIESDPTNGVHRPTLGILLDQIVMDDALIQMWYSVLFSIAWAIAYECNDDAHFRPLLAVDFGNAAWIQLVEAVESDSNNPRHLGTRRVRLATFPAVFDEREYKDRLSPSRSN